MGKDNVVVDLKYNTISTDMGDLSAIMPVIHPYMPGATGNLHGSDFIIKNPQTACVDSAKVQLIMLYKLLSNNAERAKYVLKNKCVQFNTKEEYFERIQNLSSEGERVKYYNNGEIFVTC